MKITQSSPRPEVILEDPAGSAAAQPNSQDVQWFAAEMQPQAFNNPVQNGGGVSGELMQHIAATFGRIEKKSDKVVDVMSKAANSTNPVDMTRVSATLSSYYLDSLMNAKIVSKSVQGLEKLTNLQ